MKIPVEFNALSELPDGWSWQPLQSLTANPKQDVVDGPFGSNLKASEYVSAGVPIARLQNIDRNTFVTKNIRFLTPVKAAELARHEFKPDDILITKLGDPLGKACIVPASIGRGVIVADLVRVRPDEKLVDRKYLTYAINSPTLVKQFELHTKGTTRPRVNLSVLRQLPIPLAPRKIQTDIVAEIEKQFSRLDEAVANLQRVKANLKRYEKATIERLTNPETFEECVSGTIADVAISLDNMRKPVNKAERATRPGNVPYLGANGQTGWIDAHLFDEEIVLVVEDETFVGRTAPFSYYFAEKCWVNNHTHVLRARPDVVSPKYLNLALSYYPFIPLTTGSTGRRKLTKGALMVAPIVVPSLVQQERIVSEVERRLSLTSEVLAEVGKNLQRSEKLRQAVLATAFGIQLAQPEH